MFSCEVCKISKNTFLTEPSKDIPSQNKIISTQNMLRWATSKTWTRTLDPDSKKTEPKKIWTLKNLDLEKPGH